MAQWQKRSCRPISHQALKSSNCAGFYCKRSDITVVCRLKKILVCTTRIVAPQLKQYHSALQHFSFIFTRIPQQMPRDSASTMSLAITYVCLSRPLSHFFAPPVGYRPSEVKRLTCFFLVAAAKHKIRRWQRLVTSARSSGLSQFTTYRIYNDFVAVIDNVRRVETCG